MRNLVFILILFSFLIANVEVEGKDRVKELRKKLLKYLRGGDFEATKATVKEFKLIGGKKSVSTLLKIIRKFPKHREKLYWSVVYGATSYTDPPALAELKKFVLSNRRRGVARDVAFGLSQNPSPNVFPIFEAILEKGPYDMKLMVVDQMSHMKEHRVIDALLKVWQKNKGKRSVTSLTMRIVKALSKHTGRKFGDNFAAWFGWWNNNRANGLSSGGGSEESYDLGPGSSGLKGLGYLNNRRIVVIKGSKCTKPNVDHNYDHIEKTLAKLNVPHTVVEKKEFASDKFLLNNTMIIMLNCTLSWEHCVCPTCKAGGESANRLKQCANCDVHKIEADRISPKGVKKIKNFVARGGYFFSEDWGLVEVLEKAWPSIIKAGDQVMKGQGVDIHLAPGQSSHPYLRDIFGFRKKLKEVDHKSLDYASGNINIFEKVGHTWKIDAESPSIKPTNRVMKILTSQKLRSETNGNGAVAVAFSPRQNITSGSKRGEITKMSGGRVLHVISHFGKQKSSGDEYTLLNLMTNFVIEAQARWDYRQKRKRKKKK